MASSQGCQFSAFSSILSNALLQRNPLHKRFMQAVQGPQLGDLITGGNSQLAGFREGKKKVESSGLKRQPDSMQAISTLPLTRWFLKLMDHQAEVGRN